MFKTGLAITGRACQLVPAYKKIQKRASECSNGGLFLDKIDAIEGTYFFCSPRQESLEETTKHQFASRKHLVPQAPVHPFRLRSVCTCPPVVGDDPLDWHLGCCSRRRRRRLGALGAPGLKRPKQKQSAAGGGRVEQVFYSNVLCKVPQRQGGVL